MSVKFALFCLMLVYVAMETTHACACPRVYWPVCGSDGVTYPNTQCMRCNKPDIRVVRHGPCKAKLEDYLEESISKSYEES